MSRAQQSERVDRESGLAAGLLGMLPLLLLYEVAQRSGLSWRSSSEMLATQVLGLLGPWEETARLAAVLAVGGVAVTACVRDGLPLVPLVGRQLVRGVVWAMGFTSPSQGTATWMVGLQDCWRVCRMRCR